VAYGKRVGWLVGRFANLQSPTVVRHVWFRTGIGYAAIVITHVATMRDHVDPTVTVVSVAGTLDR
jgi:hypothetical protein